MCCFRYTLLNEAWRLVESGVLSVSDIDAVMSEGLGMRYAFLGMCSIERSVQNNCT